MSDEVDGGDEYHRPDTISLGGRTLKIAGSIIGGGGEFYDYSIRLTPLEIKALTPKPADDVVGLPDVTELMWVLDEAIDVFGKAAEQWGWESDQGSDADAKASEAEHKRTRDIVYDKADLVTAALRSAHATIATLRRQIDERDAEVGQLRDAVKYASYDGGSEAYADVYAQALRIYDCDQNEFSDRHAVMAFADRFKVRAALFASTISNRAQIATTPAPAVDEMGGE